ncbi:unnamed protein product [Rangifer tarandus platyrhynchus]|uniref:Uncharacterized protein n=2 Tax=Rangifer tarandus platyrhynchus TaxID=3082113 RepID=A0ABN8Y9D9_RANTA|nr:unnamed protein product [Rangifer tarandus platyrhynchus]CAI9696103.1 unnamed protein product [Rangifer tarandus platyrhynchus]
MAAAGLPRRPSRVGPAATAAACTAVPAVRHSRRLSTSRPEPGVSDAGSRARSRWSPRLYYETRAPHAYRQRRPLSCTRCALPGSSPARQSSAEPAGLQCSETPVWPPELIARAAAVMGLGRGPCWRWRAPGSDKTSMGPATHAPASGRGQITLRRLHPALGSGFSADTRAP